MKPQYKLPIYLLLLIPLVLIVARRHRRRSPTPSRPPTTAPTRAPAATAPTPRAPTSALPADAIVLDASDANSITPPFVAGSDPASTNVTVLALPRGSASRGKQGAARFSLNANHAGEYHVWSRVHWLDSCGNSLALGLDDMPRRTIGQDSIYKRWHWVRAGRYKLSAGRHTLWIGEREDGIRLDQLLFTRDARFAPSGRLLSAGPATDHRCFADDFTRSADRGLMFWKPLSGTWEIAFTLDPNRIPHQYALVGRADSGNDAAVALLKERPWRTCRLAFSVLPTAPGSFGAVLDRTPDGRPPLAVNLEAGGDSARLAVSSPSLEASADLGDIVELDQWHRVIVERNAGTLRVLIDDKEVLKRACPAPGARTIGLTATSKTVFDDIVIHELPARNNAPDVFTIGPYHFTRPVAEDPSDFLDFTPQEFRDIQNSPAIDKLKRRRKFLQLVGRGDKVFWQRQSGFWRVQHGVLAGTGPHAVLKFSREIISCLELKMKVLLSGSNTAVEFELYAGDEPGISVKLDPQADAAQADRNSVVMPVATGRDWHDLVISVTDTGLRVKLDDRTQDAPVSRPTGGAILLRVPAGSAEFDDIEFAVPRRTRSGALYAFDRRETGLRRLGKVWTDHAGIACVLASNWITLVAPKSRGALWTKSPVKSDLLAAVDAAEYSEWYGWRRGHAHHPIDNICVFLSPGHDPDRGYRLEVNSRNRSHTVLYRNGTEVACVRQDASFPIRYVGGHAPYTPRTSRIALVKDGNALRAVVNGRLVLSFTDPSPLPVAHAGIGGYNTRVNFSNFEIRTLD